MAPLELVAGLALIAGWRATLAALATLPVLLGATAVHAGNGWSFTSAHGGWEFPAVLVLLAAGVALLGEGAFSVRRPGRSSPRWARRYPGQRRCSSCRRTG